MDAISASYSYSTPGLVCRSAEEALVQSKSLGFGRSHRLRRRIAKTLYQPREAFEITVSRNERDSMLAARRSDQCVIEQRRLFVEYLPPFACDNRRDNAATIGQGGPGWC